MRKRLLLLMFAISMAGAVCGQTTLLNENFANGIPGTWTMYSDGQTVHSNISGYFPTAWAVVDGAAAAPSWFTPAGTADRWLITPAVTISGNNPALRFVMQSIDPNYLESLNVKISTTDTEKESFTVTALTATNIPGRPDWTSYIVPLTDYAGQTIYIAFQLVSNDAFWLNLDDVYVGEVPPNAAAIAGVSTPSYSPMGTPVNVEISIKNNGSAAITGFSATYTVDSTTSEVYNATDVNVAPGATYTFTHPTAYNPEGAGSKIFTVTVSAINGSEVAADNDDNLSGTTIVYNAADAVPRTHLLEQFSSTRENYTPDATNRIGSVIANRNDVIHLIHHAGFYDDEYTCTASQDLTFLYNSNGGTYAPAMMIDRTRLDEVEPGPVTSVGDTATIRAMLSDAAAIPSFGTVEFSGDFQYDTTTRRVSSTSALMIRMNPAYISGQNITISVFYVEDSIVGSQAGIDTPYIHNNVVRDCLTSGFGQTVSFGASGMFNYTVSYTLPEGFDASHGRFVAVLSNYDSTNANNCYVINAAQTSYFQLGGSSGETEDNVIRVSRDIVLCQGDNYSNYGLHLDNIQGNVTHEVRVENENGADSIITLNFIVNPTYTTSLFSRVCQGYDYIDYGFNLMDVQTSGQHEIHYESINGCDSTISLTLVVDPTYHTSIVDNVCQGSNYVENGFNLPAVAISGEHSLTLPSVRTGCDSTVSLLLTVNPTYATTLTANACQGSDYLANGFNLTNVQASGNYNLNLSTLHGCDSTMVLTLTVNPSYDTMFAATICQGEDYTAHGFNIIAAQVSDTHSRVLTSVNGCDSTLLVSLTLNPVYSTSLVAAVCLGSDYTENGFNLSNVQIAGSHSLALQSAQGCDSTVNLLLNVNPTYNIPIVATTCQGSDYTENGFTLLNVQESDTLTHMQQSIHCCDSTTTLFLTVTPTYDTVIEVEVERGGSYNENGINLDDIQEDVTLTDVYPTIYGCDSTVTIRIKVKDVSIREAEGNDAFEATLYPNPANEMVTLHISTLETDASVEIYDALGRVALRETLNAGQTELCISLDAFVAGTYSMRICNENGCVVRRLVVR